MYKLIVILKYTVCTLIVLLHSLAKYILMLATYNFFLICRVPKDQEELPVPVVKMAPQVPVVTMALSDFLEKREKL